MPKRSSTGGRRDLNRLAASIVEQATEGTIEPVESPLTVEERHAAAVALGRIGGKKGGRARADKLTPEQRSAIARRAAESRWAAAKGK